jgi:hypothetical protein
MLPKLQVKRLCLAGSCLLAVVQLACDNRADIATEQPKPVAAVENERTARETNRLPKRIDDTRNLSEALAEFAPEDVRKHLMESEPGQWGKWMPAFYREWGKLDGNAAMQSAVAEENALVSRAAGAVLKAWAKVDVSAAQQWVDSTPKGRAQMQFAGIVINSIESPRDAAEWLAHLNPENVSNLSDIVSRIGVRWISKEPLAALIWLESMADEKMRETATMQTFFQWSKQDPEAASAFLAQLDPREPFYSLAAEGLARAISMTDAEGALAWADQITPSQRARSGLDDALLFGAQTLLRDTDNNSGEAVQSPPSPVGMRE